MIPPYRAKDDLQPYFPTVIDIETDPAGTVIGVGFAWHIDGERMYWSGESWSDWLTFYQTLLKQNKGAKQLKRIYAHNGAGFDYLSLIEWAYENDFLDKLEYIHSDCFGIGVNITLGKSFIRLRDSFRLLPQGLGKLCKTFKTEHQKLDIDVLPHALKASDPARYWSYLENDCYALQEVLHAFWSMVYDLAGSVGELPMTLPSLASRLWRMTLGTGMLTPWNEKLKTLERRAYTGGRTECYEVGIADVKVYDANSLYPAAMLSGTFPLSYRGGWTNEYTGEHGIYHLRYTQTNRRHKPVLRDEATQDFLYEGEGVYCQPEIERLLHEGGTIDVISGYLYEDMGNPFRDFITRWWNVRLQAIRDGNSALAYVCKILMNSLYGKFGQREEGWTLKLWTADEQIEALENGVRFKPAGEYVLVHEKRHSENTFVGIAAYITATARLNLYDAMCLQEDAGATIRAVDTDSTHTENGSIVTGDGLGEWKLEYEGTGIYLGKKLYALDGQTPKAKGIGRNAPGLNYELFQNIADGEIKEAALTFTAFPTWRDVLIHGKKSSVMIERTRTIRATAPIRKE